MLLHMPGKTLHYLLYLLIVALIYLVWRGGRVLVPVVSETIFLKFNIMWDAPRYYFGDPLGRGGGAYNFYGLMEG